MNLMSKFFTKSAKGFTLIELLVVVAVIGLLASIVLASLREARQNANDAKRMSDIRNIQKQLSCIVLIMFNILVSNTVIVA